MDMEAWNASRSPSAHTRAMRGGAMIGARACELGASSATASPFSCKIKGRHTAYQTISNNRWWVTHWFKLQEADHMSFWSMYRELQGLFDFHIITHLVSQLASRVDSTRSWTPAVIFPTGLAQRAACLSCSSYRVKKVQINNWKIAGSEWSQAITLWWTNILPWKITIFNGKIHYKWQFSIAMLVHQRVTVAVLWTWARLPSGQPQPQPLQPPPPPPPPPQPQPVQQGQQAQSVKHVAMTAHNISCSGGLQAIK